MILIDNIDNPETGEKGRYKDEVLSNKTPFKVVLEVAQSYPLRVAPAVVAKPAPAPVPETLPQVAPAPPPAPGPAPPKPPAPMPPSVQVNSQNDMGNSTKSMYRSKRFWGGVLIITGRLIIVADIGGHFAPAVRSFIGDGVLMDWMTGVIVTMIGEAVLDRGEKKAEGPLDTPKRAAIAAQASTQTPANQTPATQAAPT